MPVGIAALIELELKTPATGAITVGASITGFVAFEAPARIRFAWQLGAAPLIGIAAALGAITGQSAALPSQAWRCSRGWPRCPWPCPGGWRSPP